MPQYGMSVLDASSPRGWVVVAKLDPGSIFNGDVWNAWRTEKQRHRAGDNAKQHGRKSGARSLGCCYV